MEQPALDEMLESIVSDDEEPEEGDERGDSDGGDSDGGDSDGGFESV